LESPEEYWSEQAAAVDWFTPPPKESILTKDENGVHRWFKGGKLNTSYLALDVNVNEGRGDQVALIFDSPVTGTVRKITYSELRDNVAKFAGALRNLGVEKGDRVVVYMPNSIEAITAVYACARLGAIHSVVFGGFAPNELKTRLDDLEPKVIVSSSCGIEGSKVIPYKPLVDAALDMAEYDTSNVKTVFLDREQHSCADLMIPGRDLWWHEVIAAADPADPVPLDATDVLYVLYTSGTTGKPKGIVRDNGGHAVSLKATMNQIMNMKPGEVYWAASDVGWVVGHTYMMYAPLLHGCTSVIFEGKPVRTPDAGAFWRMIEEHKINGLFTAPTAVRAIRKEDPNGDFIKKYDVSSLDRGLFFAGERLDKGTFDWLQEVLPEAHINDNWWQTETGSPICANMHGIERVPSKGGSCTFPAPGFDLQILDDAGHPVPQGKEGNIALKLPLPPCVFPTVWGDHDRMNESYFQEFPGYYESGDAGVIDEDGYVFVLGRTDDVINVAAHRLSTGEMEEVVGGHEVVAECAVIGVNDALKGEVPFGFVILKDTHMHVDQAEASKELNNLVRGKIGAIATLKKIVFVNKLPKTRSGKILRKTMRQLTETPLADMPVPSTIDDATALDHIYETVQKHKIGPLHEDK